MTSWFSKNECTANIEKVKEFYLQVLEDFLNKIYKDVRFKASGGLDEQKIDQLSEVNLPNSAGQGLSQKTSLTLPKMHRDEGRFEQAGRGNQELNTQ